MLVNGIPEKEGSLGFLKSLIANKHKQVYGVFYTNSFFSQRYLCRQHLLNKVEFTEDSLKLTIATRLEQVGLLEIENTLDMLVRYEAGDIPGLMPEGLLDPEDDVPTEFLPEAISVTQYLTSVDLLLTVKDPEVTYQIFNIAGSKFTLVNIHHKLGEDFEQTITLLFGTVGKLYFLSHFYDKELNEKDVKLIMDLIVDENITGKAVIGVNTYLPGGVHTSVLPFDRLISSYTSQNGDYVFGDGSGYVYIPRERLSDYDVRCVSDEKGSYTLEFRHAHYVIRLMLE